MMLLGFKIVVGAVWLALTIYTVGHVMLHKSNAASAWGWIVSCLLMPFVGPGLYALFGINRVQTRARKRRMPRTPAGDVGSAHEADARRRRAADRPAVPSALSEVARTGDVVTRRPLLDHNRLEILHNGEQAYPRMLAAIDAAQASVALMVYIFETDEVGQQFVDALQRAQARGVQVRCLLDGIGEFAWKRAGSVLFEHGLIVARFNPLRFWPPFLHVNLRNHRKVLVVDGQIGFAGGMNICVNHLADRFDNPCRITDVHIEIHGPVLAQLVQVFADDWAYASGEEWSPPRAPKVDTPPSSTAAEPDIVDSTICRVITDGPNEDYAQLSLVLLAAINAAHRHIHVVVPYFLPPAEIMMALQSAALRGVLVDIILPLEHDQILTHYAARNQFEPLLERGVRVYYQPPPFCHAKLFVVDGHYAQFGSANLDPRSLRLNFELMVEVFDADFAGRLAEHCVELRDKAHRITREEMRARPLFARLRDALCWLFGPYL